MIKHVLTKTIEAKMKKLMIKKRKMKVIKKSQTLKMNLKLIIKYKKILMLLLFLPLNKMKQNKKLKKKHQMFKKIKK